MDIETGPSHASLLGTSPAIVGPKFNNTPFSAGGLTRYHSAPSSVLAGLLDDNFFPASDDSDFARLLNDGIGSFSTLLETKHSPIFTVIPKEKGTYAPSRFTAVPKEEDAYAHTSSAKDNHSNYGAFHEPLLQSPLASISEHGGEDTAGTYLLDQLPLSSPCAISQASQHPFHARTDSSPSHSTEFTSLPKFSSGLVRQGSSPADNISRVVIDDNIEDVKLGSGLAGPCQTGKEEKGGSQMCLSSTQVSASISTFSDVQRVNPLQQVASPKKSSSLLRHSSSPACLLSQINLEDFTNPGASSSEYFLDRRGLMSFKGSAEGRWEAMQHLPALSQRKRGRVVEDKTSISMQGNPELANASSTTPTTAPNTMAETMESLEGYPEDIVLCKARAKRGCATHPRSIAERQRRMKISERMKKLQDLVPNLDKQASTAEMLDEVVEYVKLLQRQVEELSLNRPVCTGACQQNSDSPH